MREPIESPVPDGATLDTTVMVVVIAILIALVCVVQFAGDTAVRRLRAR